MAMGQYAYLIALWNFDHAQIMMFIWESRPEHYRANVNNQTRHLCKLIHFNVTKHEEYCTTDMNKTEQKMLYFI